MPLPFAVALVLPSEALAQAPQYRRLNLTDGREIRAEVLSTEATGLRMRTPQGETLVSFEILMDMVPIDPLEYRDQPATRVWVEPGPAAADLKRIYGAIPATQVLSADQPGDLPPDAVEAIGKCEGDFDCIGAAIGSARWMWVVTAAPPVDGTASAMAVRARSSGGPPLRRSDALTTSIQDLWHAAHEVVELIAPATIPKVVTAPTEIPGKDPGRAAWTLDRASRLTPPRLLVPGLSSLQQGDVGRGMLGVGIGVVGTGLAVGVTAMSASEQKSPVLPVVVVGAGAWVALGAFTNAWLGPESYAGRKVGLRVEPRPEGAVVSLAGPL